MAAMATPESSDGEGERCFLSGAATRPSGRWPAEDEASLALPVEVVCDVELFQALMQR
jgi:hypothetical protein